MAENHLLQFSSSLFLYSLGLALFLISPNRVTYISWCYAATVTLRHPLKGVWHEIFDFRLFCTNQCPPGRWVFRWGFKFFWKFAEIFSGVGVRVCEVPMNAHFHGGSNDTIGDCVSGRRSQTRPPIVSFEPPRTDASIDTSNILIRDPLKPPNYFKPKRRYLRPPKSDMIAEVEHGRRCRKWPPKSDTAADSFIRTAMKRRVHRHATHPVHRRRCHRQ